MFRFEDQKSNQIVEVDTNNTKTVLTIKLYSKKFIKVMFCTSSSTTLLSQNNCKLSKVLSKIEHFPTASVKQIVKKY